MNDRFSDGYTDAMEVFARLYADMYSKPGRESAFHGACELMKALYGVDDLELFTDLACAMEVIGEDPEMYGF